jgi:hypothetical protein
MHMSSHTLSHETRRALDNLKAYLAGENEAVQYAFSFLADMVTQNPSAMLGGIPAGSLPASEVVSDPNGQVFAVDPSISGTFKGIDIAGPEDGRIFGDLDGPAGHVNYHRLRTMRGRPQRTPERPVHVRDPARRCKDSTF